jgi:hypothetical protein
MEQVGYAAPVTGAWTISREGNAVASVDVTEEGGGVAVTAIVGKKKPSSYQFASIEAADAFVRDLLASFTYLGCDVGSA